MENKDKLGIINFGNGYGKMETLNPEYMEKARYMDLEIKGTSIVGPIQSLRDLGTSTLVEN